MSDKASPPQSLPPVRGASTHQEQDASRVCEKCASESVRIASGFDDVRAYCRECGHSWAISLAALTTVPMATMERGFRRETLVEPDWNIAYEND